MSTIPLTAIPQRESRTLVIPRSLIACLPTLWQKLLFPGLPRDAEPRRCFSLFVLLVLPGLLLYPCLSFHLFEPDEGRYAEIPREMLARGEWVVPYLQSEPYLDKPPLFYWLVMVSYALFGVSDGTARLVPALAVHATILTTYWFGRRHLGERAAFWGALILGLAPAFLCVGRLLTLDGLLTLWVAWSICAGYEAMKREKVHRGWWLLASIACGLGVLTKGPVAVLLLVPPLVAYRWLTFGRVGLGLRAWAALAGIVLVVALPWYVAVCIRLPEFARYFLWEHNVVRFFAPFDHLRPVWFYAPIVLFGLMPGTLLLVSLGRLLLSSAADDSAHRPAALGFVLLAGGWCVFFFSMSGCKLPTYILPAFPFLALSLGHAFVRSRWVGTRWVPVTVGSSLALLSAAHFIAIPWYAEHHSPLSRPEQVWEHCADPDTALVCYPRDLDSVGFYLGRDDLKSFRSKDSQAMIEFLMTQPKAVVLCSHRHSIETLRRILPAELRLRVELPLFGSAKPGPEGMCYMAVIERNK